jgi:lysophospholipase L1-like esterase
VIAKVRQWAGNGFVPLAAMIYPSLVFLPKVGRFLIRVLLLTVLINALTSCSSEFLPAFPFSKSLNDSSVFMGDSITQFWPMPEHNQGISGQQTSQMLNRFGAEVLGHGYKRVVILGGTNDIILPPHDLSAVALNLDAMATMAQAAGIEVVLCKLLPITWDGNDLNSQVDAVNESIKELANKKGYLLVDYNTPMIGHPEYFRDGVHPKPIGYAVMESTLSTVVSPQ